MARSMSGSWSLVGYRSQQTVLMVLLLLPLLCTHLPIPNEKVAGELELADADDALTPVTAPTTCEVAVSGEEGLIL